MRALPELSALETAIAAVEHAQSASGFTTLQYEVELITPMLGGGVVAGEADTAMPFRARSLRGHFRMWWRILARGGAINFAPGSRPDSEKAWRDLELSIWGGVSDNLKQEKARASFIGLHICNPRGAEAIRYENVRGSPLDYALCGAHATKPNLVVCGASFNLIVTIKKPALLEQVEAVIRYWATFGGIGARTSRGMGAVRVRKIQAGKPGPYLCELLSTGQIRPNQKVTFLCDGLFQIFVPLGSIPNSQPAHEHCITTLRDFRQQPGFARDQGQGKRPGMTRWPEANTIRLDSDHYLGGHDPNGKTFQGIGFAPRADFGLPIRIWFKDGPGEGATADVPHCDPLARNLLPPNLDTDRMASPMILRPVATPDGKFFSVAALINRPALEGVSAPDRARWRLTEVRLDPPAGTTDRLPVWAAGLSTGLSGSGPLAAYRSGEAFKDAQSAVEAFLNYFMSRRP